MLKNAQTYEIMTPESVGLNRSTLVMGKHSGRHAFRAKLKELGYELGDNAVEEAFVRFKDLADKKKDVFDEDIVALVDDSIGSTNERIRFVSLMVVAGSKGPQKAELELEIDGETVSTTATGDGPVDATFNAIAALFPHEAPLAAVSGPCRHRGHRRPGRSDRAAGGKRQDRERSGSGYGHAGGKLPRLCARVEQVADQASENRAGSTLRLSDLRRCSMEKDGGSAMIRRPDYPKRRLAPEPPLPRMRRLNRIKS